MVKSLLYTLIVKFLQREIDDVNFVNNTGRHLLACIPNNGHRTMNEASIQSTSHNTYHCLTHSQLAEQLHLMHKTYQHTKQQLRRMKEKVNEIIEQDGIWLDECMHIIITGCMQEKSKLVNDSFQPDSFQLLFWKQQMQVISKKNSKAIRWHPLIIKWCIYLQHLSSGAYEVLRPSGCVKPPSQWTLRDYTHYLSETNNHLLEFEHQMQDTNHLLIQW